MCVVLWLLSCLHVVSNLRVTWPQRSRCELTGVIQCTSTLPLFAAARPTHAAAPSFSKEAIRRFRNQVSRLSWGRLWCEANSFLSLRLITPALRLPVRTLQSTGPTAQCTRATRNYWNGDANITNKHWTTLPEPPAQDLMRPPHHLNRSTNHLWTKSSASRRKKSKVK